MIRLPSLNTVDGSHYDSRVSVLTPAIHHLQCIIPGSHRALLPKVLEDAEISMHDTGYGSRMEMVGLSIFPAAKSAPTIEIPEMAFAPDMRGVCSCEGTLTINSKPRKIASTNVNKSRSCII